MGCLSTCRTCDHWQPDETALSGDCRFNPPQTTIVLLPHPTDSRQTSGQLVHLKVITLSDYWCSRHSEVQITS